MMMKKLILPLLLLATSAHAADKLKLERLEVNKWPTVRMYLTYVFVTLVVVLILAR